jgi:hypothetical protein
MATIAPETRASTHHWILATTPEMKDIHERGGHGGFNASLLHRDFENRQYAYRVGIKYDGVDYQHGSAILKSLLHELSHNSGRNEVRLFMQLVSTVARDHLMYGRCMFELFDATENGPPGPRLGILPGWSLKHSRRKTVQARLKNGRVEWNPLPAAALAQFRLPEHLGKKLHHTMKLLRILDATQPGDPSMLAAARSTGYDFSTHRKMLDTMAAQATKSIGWSGRDIFLSRGTNSYRTYRQLRFIRTWLTVVSATTDTINNICKIPAVNGGKALTLRTTGLPTIAEVDDSINSVISGAESLDNIFNNVLHPR